MESNNRLTPSNSTVRSLYIHSGNLCAMDSCNNFLIDRDGAWMGEIAHIHAASDNGPRANLDLTAEERRDESNLILLCRNCHKKIDENVDKYTVEKLKSMKEKHESRYRSGLDNLDSFYDCSDNYTINIPSDILVYDFDNKEDRMCYIKELNTLASRLVKVPVLTRKFFVHCLYRAKCFNDGVLVSALKHSLHYEGGSIRIDKQFINEAGEILQKFEIAYFYFEEKGDYYSYSRDPEVYICFSDTDMGVMEGIWDLAKKNSKDGIFPSRDFLNRVIVDLDFSVLG